LQFFCAVITFVWTYIIEKKEINSSLESTISVIIVAGACGVAAGTPLAILGAIGRVAQKGAIIKGGIYLELLSKVDTIFFDKTGTVTVGDPRVVGVIVYEDMNKEELMMLAKAAEKLSEHPLARAILKEAENLIIENEDVQVENWEYTPGKGIVCDYNEKSLMVGNEKLMLEKNIDINKYQQSNSYQDILLAYNNTLVGCIQVADVLRTESKSAIEQLKNLGYSTVLLTGDSKHIADHIGQVLSIDQVLSEKLPDQKVQCVKQKKIRGINSSNDRRWN